MLGVLHRVLGALAHRALGVLPHRVLGYCDDTHDNTGPSLAESELIEQIQAEIQTLRIQKIGGTIRVPPAKTVRVLIGVWKGGLIRPPWGNV